MCPNNPSAEEVGGLDGFLYDAAQNFEDVSNIQYYNKKIRNLQLMSFSRPIQWYHFHAELMWPEGTFNVTGLRRELVYGLSSQVLYILIKGAQA